METQSSLQYQMTYRPGASVPSEWVSRTCHLHGLRSSERKQSLRSGFGRSEGGKDGKNTT